MGGSPGSGETERPGGPYRGRVRTVGNIVWFALAGLWLAIGYAVAGALAFVLIVTIPFGIAAFRLAGFVVWPFGRTVVRRTDAGAWSLIGNVVWILVFGWELVLVHLVAGLLLCLTVIGVPFGIACWKMVPLALLPLGSRVVPIGTVRNDPYRLPTGAVRP